MKLLANISLDTLQGLGEIGQGEVGKPLADKWNAFNMLRNIISLAIGVMTVVGFIWFFFLIVSAAITWLGSGGEKNKIQQAQKQITNGIIGLVVLISATFIIKVIEVVLGIRILGGIRDLIFPL